MYTLKIDENLMIKAVSSHYYRLIRDKYVSAQCIYFENGRGFFWIYKGLMLLQVKTELIDVGTKNPFKNAVNKAIKNNKLNNVFDYFLGE
jgi:hypothetical protein